MLKHHIVESEKTSKGEFYEIWRIFVSEDLNEYSSYGLYIGYETDVEEQGVIYKTSETQIEPFILGNENEVAADSPELLVSYCTKIEKRLRAEYPQLEVIQFQDKFSIEI